MEQSAKETWKRLLDQARARLPEPTLRTWLEPAEGVSLENGLLVVATPDQFAAEWNESKHAKLLSQLAAETLGRELIAPLRGRVEYNIEGDPRPDLLDLVHRVRPDQCTLVPDDPAALTSDHGWNLPRDAVRLKPVVAELKALGIRVSLFMDPVPESMAHAREAGADRVELYTEPYVRAFGSGDERAILEQYAEAARAAQRAGLGVNAGHDLNRLNLPCFLRAVPAVLRGDEPRRLVEAVVDELGGPRGGEPALDRALAFVACRAAVKANTPLAREEMERLVADLGATATPYFCPHGRPIVSRVSLHDIRRELKRTW